MVELKAIASTVGAILINLTLGTFYSIGNLIPYVTSYMRGINTAQESASNATWVTASFLLGQGIFILLGSYIEQKFDSRVGTILGCIIHSASTFATIWAMQVNFLAVILVYGLGSGLGCGSAYMSSIINAQKWYPKHKGVATGIIVAGFGFGGLIFTSLQTLYLNPENKSANIDKYYEGTVYKRVPSMFLYMGMIFTVAQTVGCILAFPAQPMGSQTTPTNTNDVNKTKSPSNTVIVTEVLPNVRTFSQIFHSKIFYIIGLLMVLVAPGVTFVNSMGKIYGQLFIDDDRFLAMVVAVAAVANALGRLTWGYLMDKFSFSICFSLKIILFSTLIVTFPFDFVLESKTLYLIWMLGLFFGFSGTFVLFPVFIEQVFGLKYNGIIYGILYIFLATSSIATSFLIQLTMTPQSAQVSLVSSLVNNFSIRFIPCVCIGVLYVTSLVVYFFAVPVKRLEHAIRRRIETEDMNQKTSLFNRQDLFPLAQTPLSERIKEGSSKSGMPSEDSLGSIVRMKEIPKDDKRIKSFTKAYMNGLLASIILFDSRDLTRDPPLGSRVVGGRILHTTYE